MKLAEIKTISFELEKEEMEVIASARNVLLEIVDQMEKYECDDLNGRDYNGDIVLSASEIDLMATQLDWLLNMEEMV